jgi:hypothetical protein
MIDPFRFLAAASLSGFILLAASCDATGVGAIAGTDGTCEAATSLLAVSSAPGAGFGYAAPELAGGCTADSFVVESNSMPHFSFVQMTPNELTESNNSWEIPLNPELAGATSDIPLLGQVAFTVTGLPIFGPNEAEFPDPYGDPVYNGITDGCFGHTAFEYHNHALEERCLTDEGLVAEPWTLAAPSSETVSPILAWSLDGFPIYGPRGCLDAACDEVVTFESGWVPTGDPSTYAWDNHRYEDSSDPVVLDECNGRVGPDGTYAYHATATFPYVIGCYRGTPL